MRHISKILFFATIGLAGISSVQAMPSLGFTAPSPVVRVAGGCGVGYHRGPEGGCRRNWANPAAHACPRGYHLGPNGGCRGN